MPLDKIEAQRLAIEVPGFDSDPIKQFLAERKLLPQQNEIESFENPSSILTSVRRSMGMYYPREEALINRQKKALEEYDMDLKAKKTVNAEITKALTLAAAMAPERISQLTGASPGIAQTIAPNEPITQIDPRAARAMGETIGGIRVSDVLNPSVMGDVIDRPLRQDERIRAGTLLEKQAAGAIAVPGQAIELPSQVSAREAGTQHIAAEDAKRQAEQKSIADKQMNLYEVENSLRYTLGDNPEEWTMNNRAVNVTPILAQKIQLRDRLLMELGYLEKGKQAIPKEPKTIFDVVSQPIKDILASQGIMKPSEKDVAKARVILEQESQQQESFKQGLKEGTETQNLIARHLFRKPVSKLTDGEAGDVLRVDEERQAAIAAGKSRSVNEAIQDAPLNEGATFWLNEKGEVASPDLSRRDARKQGYRPVTQPDLNAVGAAKAGLAQIDEYKKLTGLLVERSGVPLLDIGKVQLNKLLLMGKRLGGDPEAKKLEALFGGIAQIARATGDTANIAVAEREFLKNFVLDEGDTYQSAVEKISQAERILRKVVRSRNVPMEGNAPIGKPSDVSPSIDDLLKKYK